MGAHGVVKEEDAGANEAKSKDPNRFYCPYPGCNRSFAELWRLKVHYRAPPDVRGSGRERGHGTELKFCPKCNKELKAGKHHVGCSAGRAGGRQNKRKAEAEAELDLGNIMQNGHMSTFSFGHGIHDFVFDNDDMFGGALLGAQPPQQPMTLMLPPQHPQHGMLGHPGQLLGAPSQVHHAFNNTPFLHTQESLGGSQAGTLGAAPDNSLGGMMGAHQQGQWQGHTQATSGDHLIMPQGGHGSLGTHTIHAGSSALPSEAGLSAGMQPGQGGSLGGAEPAPSWPGFGSGSQPFLVPDVGGSGPHDDDLTSDLLPHALSPSPPPLPPDWDASVKPSGLLFDFDSFNAAKKKDMPANGRPFVTVTSSMNPADMACPSDDYIMQILFGDANEPVPRRMTTHLHQFDTFDDGLADFDKDPEPHETLDDLLAKGPLSDLGALGPLSAPMDPLSHHLMSGSKDDLFAALPMPSQLQQQPQQQQQLHLHQQSLGAGQQLEHKPLAVGSCDLQATGGLTLAPENHMLSVQQS